ncbi:MAG TPA: RagB/SusD family nutrient uptake outer membrane protein [Membranihabitans sp.]|nr:RagB/SusD family nutrient uptake outer membrane protein [Membranihabitans sp.]
MRKIISLVVSVVFVLSCSLDIEPISEFSASGFYKTADDARAGVYGIYNAAQSAFGRNLAFWGEGRADAVDTRHSGDPRMLLNNTLNKDMRSANWTGLYQIISRANYAVKYVPEVLSDEGLGATLMGQARGLRAMAYFYAVRIWGDVPLVLEPFEGTEQEIFVRRTDQETVLAQVEQDLLYASRNAPTGGEKTLFTSGAAYALLTHLYMWQHDYGKASSYADTVMADASYTLVSIDDWNKIFTNGNSRESIFEIGYNEDQTNMLRVLYALGSDSDYFPSETFMNTFENGDLRQDLIYDVTRAFPRMIWKFFGKGFNDEDPSPSTHNIVMLRLADIVLLKAEALLHLGDTPGALELLNRIRSRAALPDLDENTAVDLYGDIESAILHERLVELSYEGYRWFDLVRTGKAIPKMNPKNGLAEEDNLVWPISGDAINRNPSLVQNEYYK